MSTPSTATNSPMQPLAEQPTSDMTSPYRGLTPYTEADAAYFFGRTGEIATVTANLEVTRLTLFYGPSGVGKTSLLRAGVIRQLQQRAKQNCEVDGFPEIIPVYFSNWQRNPLASLTQTIYGEVQKYTSGLVNNYDSTQKHLINQLIDWCEQTQSDILLVLDQFEEHFQYSPTSWSPTSFDTQLVQIINHSILRVNILISLREDTLAYLDRYEGRIPFLLDNRLSINHLTRSTGHEAINGPIEQFNRDEQAEYSIDNSLVEAVLDQVGSGEVTLQHRGVGIPTDNQDIEKTKNNDHIEAPYLQLVLTRLWDQEQANGSSKLHLKTLHELGGATKIVRNYLDDTLDTLLPEERTIAANFFDRLVTPSGTKIALTINDLAQYTKANASSLQVVIEKLEKHRLLRKSMLSLEEEQYEIFHDVLSQPLLDWQERYQSVLEEKQRQEEERQKEEEERQKEEDRKRSENLRLQRLILLCIAFIFVTSATIFYLQSRLILGANLALQAGEFARNKELRLATLLALEAKSLNPSQGEHILDNEIPFLVPYSYPQALWEQGNNAKSVVWRPDGHALASATSNNTIIIWDPQNGQKRYTLRGHQDIVLDIAWHPDEQKLASVSRDRSVIIWDVKNEIPLYNLGHSNIVRSIAWHPNGQILASASKEGHIILWDAEKGELLSTLIGHKDEIWDVAWTPDGRLLASASLDNTIILWDTHGNRVRTLDKHRSRVVSLAWHSSGGQLATASDDTTIIIWNLETAESRILREHRSKVLDLSWQPDGEQLAIATKKNTIILWDTQADELSQILRGHKNEVLSVDWRPDGQQLASTSRDATVILWDMERSATLALEHYNAVESVDWRPDGMQLVAASWDGTATIWDSKTGESVRNLQGHTSAILDVAWRPNSQQIATASVDNTIIIWNAVSGQSDHTLRGHKGAVRSVAWSPTGEQLISGSQDDTIVIWDANSGEPINTLMGHSMGVLHVSWNTDGDKVASVSLDQSIIIWNVKTGQKIHTLYGHTDHVWDVAWQPNGPYLASASKDNTIVIWDTESGEPVHVLQGHHGPVWSVRWRPDGQQLASGSDDKTIILWNSNSGTTERTLGGHTDSVTSIAWRPDGKQLASGSRDQFVIVYPRQYLESPCRWAESNLTVDEWIQYRGRALYRPTCPDYSAPSILGAINLLLGNFNLLSLTIEGRLVWIGSILYLALLFIILITIVRDSQDSTNKH